MVTPIGDEVITISLEVFKTVVGESIEAIEKKLPGIIDGNQDQGVAQVFDVDAIAGEVDGVGQDDRGVVGLVFLDLGGLHGRIRGVSLD